MKRWIERAMELLLLALVAGLLVLAAAPARRTVPAPRQERHAPDDANLPDPSRTGPASSPPDAIVALFYRPRPGLRERAEPQAEAEPEARPLDPVEAPWLVYVGHLRGADGRPFFYIKDSRNGRVIRIAEGETSDWILVEAGKERIVVRHEGVPYAVARNR